MKPVYAAFSSVAGNTRLRLYLSEYQIKKKKKKYSVYIDIYIFTLARRNLEFLTKCESNRADKVREGGRKGVSREHRRISWNCLFREGAARVAKQITRRGERRY